MLAKVLIKRKFVMGKDKEINALLNKFRSEAVGQPGLVSAESLVMDEEPQNLLVISTWASLDDWNRWKDSDVRKKYEGMLEIYQEKPSEYEAYRLRSFSSQ